MALTNKGSMISKLMQVSQLLMKRSLHCLGVLPIGSEAIEVPHGIRDIIDPPEKKVLDSVATSALICFKVVR